MDSLAVAIQGDERISVKESSSQYSVRSKDDDYSVYGLPSDAHDMKSLYEFLGVSTPFDPRAQFTTSPFLSPGLLAACRLLIAFYILFTLIFVLVWDAVRLHSANSYFSYFTELSNIGLCSYFFASGVQTFVYARSGGRSYPLERWPKFLQFLHILLFSTITTFPILVTIVYWGELYPQSPFSDAFGAWENVSLHALNTVFAFFEITTTNAGPTPYNHCIFIVLLLACYLGVAYITHATQGFYTYGFLNPSNKSSGVLAAWIIGIGVAGVIIFLITRTLCLIRTVLVNRYSTRSRSTDEENVTVEALDEWEAIDIDRPNPRSSNGRKSNDASRENGTSIEVGSSEDEKRRT